MNLKSSSAVGGCSILLGILFSQSVYTFGCGPDFPNQLLDRGDDAVLAAPTASFDRELQRMQLKPGSFVAVPATNDYANQTIEADLADLRSALRKTDLSKTAREEIVSNYETQRSKLASSPVAIDARSADSGNTTEQSTTGRIENVSVPMGLPGEFADYFSGRVAWRADRTNEARAVWAALLDRPALPLDLGGLYAGQVLAGRRFG